MAARWRDSRAAVPCRVLGSDAGSTRDGRTSARSPQAAFCNRPRMRRSLVKEGGKRPTRWEGSVEDAAIVMETHSRGGVKTTLFTCKNGPCTSVNTCQATSVLYIHTIPTSI